MTTNQVANVYLVMNRLVPYRKKGDKYAIIAGSLLTLLSSIVAEHLSAQLANPCHFPSPDLTAFATHCQFEYHQIPYLCDPFGMLSRTETELLDRHVQKLLNVTGRRAAGCVCPHAGSRIHYTSNNKVSNETATMRKRKRRNYRRHHSSSMAEAKTLEAESCKPQIHQQSSALRLAVLLVPFTSFDNINSCLQREHNPLIGGYGGEESLQVHNFNEHFYVNEHVSAAMSYTKQVFAKWVLPRHRPASSSYDQLNVNINNAPTCENVDAFITYIQRWMPNNTLRSFVGRIYKRRASRDGYRESVHSVVGMDATPFETLLLEVQQMVKVVQGSSLPSKEAEWLADLERPYGASDILALQKARDFKSISGGGATSGGDNIPMWAWFVVAILLLVVVIMLYIGNCVSRRLAISQKHKKYSMNSVSRHGGGGASSNGAGGCGNRNTGFSGGFLAGGVAGGTTFGGAALSGGASSGGAGGTAQVAQTKSSMMFRQFAGTSRRSATASRNAHVQKI